MVDDLYDSSVSHPWRFRDVGTISSRGRRCYLDLGKARPGCCGEAEPLTFHDGVYVFWALDYAYDYTSSIVCRAREGVDPWDRLKLLSVEIERENAEEETKVAGKTKYGPIWQLREFVRIGAQSHQYARMLKAIYRVNVSPRRAMRCEALHWLNGHKDDALGLQTDLVKLWGHLVADALQEGSIERVRAV